MDDALVPNLSTKTGSIKVKVLILVVMDDALVPIHENSKSN